jgi:hypothetical protein
MAAEIRVEKEGEGKFRVTVSEGPSRSAHSVSLAREYYEKLTGGKIAADELVRRSFEFLLEREPKESILGRFDLSVIARYFPEYEREVRKQLGT